MFKRNEHTEDYHNKKPNAERFQFEIEDKKYFHVGEKLVTFETNDKTVNYSSDLGFNDFKYPFAYNEKNIFCLLHQKFLPIQY